MTVHTLVWLPGADEIPAVDAIEELVINSGGRSVSVVRPEQRITLEVPTGTLPAAQRLMEELLRPLTECGDFAPSALHLVPYGIAPDGGIFWGRTRTVEGARALSHDKLPARLPAEGEQIVFPAEPATRSDAGCKVHVVQYLGWMDRFYQDGPSCCGEFYRFGPWVRAADYREDAFGESPAARFGRMTRALLAAWLREVWEGPQLSAQEAMGEVRETLDAVGVLASQVIAYAQQHGVDEMTIAEEFAGSGMLGQAVRLGYLA